MNYYYFDIETTGLDPLYDKIITFQYQGLSLTTGEPLTKLIIEKECEPESSEAKLLVLLKGFLIDHPVWNFVPVGNNLTFDFLFIGAKIRHYFGLDVCTDLVTRPCLDLKHVLVIINRGRFKNYGRVLKKTSAGNDIPAWYQNGEFDKIIDYIRMEAAAFIRTYTFLKRQLPFLNETPV